MQLNFPRSLNILPPFKSFTCKSSIDGSRPLTPIFLNDGSPNTHKSTFYPLFDQFAFCVFDECTSHFVSTRVSPQICSSSCCVFLPLTSTRFCNGICNGSKAAPLSSDVRPFRAVRLHIHYQYICLSRDSISVSLTSYSRPTT